MDNFKKAFSQELDDKVIYEAYKLVAEFQFYVTDKTQIKTRIYENINGTFSYENSHHYQGSSQTGPYISSLATGHKTIAEALKQARKELFAYFNKDDKNARWIQNESFD